MTGKATLMSGAQRLANSRFEELSDISSVHDCGTRARNLSSSCCAACCACGVIPPNLASRRAIANPVPISTAFSNEHSALAAVGAVIAVSANATLAKHDLIDMCLLPSLVIQTDERRRVKAVRQS